MSPRFLVVWLAALTVLSAPASGQVAYTLDDHEAFCVLRVDDPGEPVPETSLRRLAPHTVTRVGGGATFEVTYTGFTAEAEAAFQRAVDIWSDHLESGVTIRVDAQFGPLDSGVLGSAGPRTAYRDDPDFPLPGTFYPEALADALNGADFASGQPDIRATFSSSFSNFYFGLDGNPPAGQFDFVTIVLHELGHGIGFVGTARFDNGAGDAECNGTSGVGCWGFGSFPIVYDRFVEDADGELFLDEAIYPNPSAELGTLLRSNALFFDGVAVTTTQGNVPPRIYAPSPFRGGSSFSHWNESSFAPGTSEALMTPFIQPGEAYADPGTNTCALFSDLGWALGPGCLVLVDDEDAPGLAAADFLVLGANPGRGVARLRLEVETAGAVRVELTDVLGRRLAVLHDGPAAVGALDLVTPSGLAPGSYLVRADGPSGTRVVRLVRL